MGRSKPRTNKRPPPKTLPTSSGEPLVPANSTPWGDLAALPNLTQSQLSAIAGAAAGVGGNNEALPIDLPASLAALFEAKLTLDREKAKLMRMQKELKGYREGVAAVSAGKGKEVAEDIDCTCGRHSDYSDEYSEEYSDLPNPYLQNHPPDLSQMTYQQALEAYRDERDSAARGLDEIGGMFKAAGWDAPEQPPRPLSEDPQRLDEAVKELFNWIKAVVWTIEQAAIVAGKRNA